MRCFPLICLLLAPFSAAAQLVERTEAPPDPDFGLVDVNPTSSTYQQAVSPRDYLKQVSGWYFGHAT